MRTGVYQAAATAIALAVTSVTIGASSSSLPSSLLAATGGGGGRRRNRLFGVATNRPLSSISSSSGGGTCSNIRHFLSSIPAILSARGGDNTNDIDVGGIDNNILVDESLYFPGLLDASVIAKGSNSGSDQTTATTNALSDCYITITQSKAHELQLHQGDLVAIIGKRRRCAYVKVNILTDKTTTTKLSSVKIGRNLANNLHIRNDDKVRLISINEIEENEAQQQQQQQKESSTTGSGSYGLGKRPTIVAKIVTLHPIKDTMSNVDDDDVSDEELISRFITPYLDSSTDDVDNDEDVAIMKEGHVLTLTDENGSVMEFTIGKLDIDHDENDDDEKDETGE